MNEEEKDNIFSKIISFRDATIIWGLADSTLRKAVATKKLVEGIDCKKFGRDWIVKIEAMYREYGEPKQNLQRFII